MTFVKHNATPLDLMQRIVLLVDLGLLLVGLGLLRDAAPAGIVKFGGDSLAVEVGAEVSREEVRRASKDSLGSDDDVVLAKLLLGQLLAFAVVEVPLEPLRADVVMELHRPVGCDGEWTDCW